MTSLVLRKVRSGGALKLVPVVPGPISEGVVKLERVLVICPACGQQVEAVATDGRVKGYCAVVKQDVDFLIGTQLERNQQYASKPLSPPGYNTTSQSITRNTLSSGFNH